MRFRTDRAVWVFFSILFLLIGCDKTKYHWVESFEGVKLWVPETVGVLYSWDGPRWSGVANGDGKLTTYNSSGSIIGTEQITAFYGAVDAKGVSRTPDGKYVGGTANRKMTGFGVLVKENEVFVGMFSSGTPNGKLDWYEKGQLRYSGNWVNGYFDGDGTLHKPDGSESVGIWSKNTLVTKMVDYADNYGEYHGYIENGKPSIRGTKRYYDGAVYSGEWKNGLFDGEGTFTKGGTTMTGTWRAGKPQGNMRQVSSSGQTFSGSWNNGKMEGSARIEFGNGDVYVGGMSDGLFEGKGCYTYASGEKYTGDFLAGYQDGEGVYESKKYKYSGHWEEGWINGEGEMRFANGDWYKGNFVENEMYGVGEYRFKKTGDRYVGEFVDGQINGLGTLYMGDGNVYEGEFEDGKIKGDGTLYCVIDGDTVAITAYWDGTTNFPKVVSMMFTNGDLYEGPIVNGQPTADGVWSQVKSGKFFSGLEKANEFYKLHKETISKAVLITGIVLSAVAITVATCGAGTPATIVAIGEFAGTANTIMASADAIASVSSKAVDGDLKGAGVDVAKEVGVDVAIAIAPKVGKGLVRAALKSKAARKEAVKLSESAVDIVKAKTKKTAKDAVKKAVKNAGRTVAKSAIKISKTEPFQKVVKVVSDGAGGLKKKMSSAKTAAFDKIRETKLDKKLTKKAEKKAIKQAERQAKQMEKKLSKMVGKKLAKRIAKLEKTVLNKNLGAQERLNALEELRLEMEKLKKTNPNVNEMVFRSFDSKTQKALDKLNDATWQSTPKSGGRWSGERGTSSFELDPSSSHYQKCKEAGQTKCNYDKSGRPDFGPATEPNSVVDCSDLYDQYSSAQLRQRGGGNNLQDVAQERMAKQMEDQIRDWWKKEHPGETFDLNDAFYKYRDSKNLVPHEDIDGTIRLVNRDVHKAFTHSGGISRINIIKDIL